MHREPGQLTEASAGTIVLGIIAFVLVVYGLCVAGLAVLLAKLVGSGL